MNEGRTAKPVGRILRLLMGTALTIHAAQHMISGDTTQNLQAAGMVLGLILLYAVVHLAISRFVPSINAWLGAVIALVPAILVFALVDPSLRARNDYSLNTRLRSALHHLYAVFVEAAVHEIRADID